MALNFGEEGVMAAKINNNLNGGSATMNIAKIVQSGERINLSKTIGAYVTKYAMGLNWNPKAGFDADCDLSVVLMKNGVVVPGMNGPNEPKCMVYYGQLEVPGVKSYGDNQDGTDGAIATPTGSDEQIDCDLSAIGNADEVIIIATTHSETKDAQGNGTPGRPLLFGRVATPVLTIYNNTNSASPEPLYTFELDEEASSSTAVEVAKFYLKNGDWKYVSMAYEVGQKPYGLQCIIDKYNIG